MHCELFVLYAEAAANQARLRVQADDNREKTEACGATGDIHGGRLHSEKKTPA
jgi:hypothetical protein